MKKIEKNYQRPRHHQVKEERDKKTQSKGGKSRTEGD